MATDKRARRYSGPLPKVHGSLPWRQGREGEAVAYRTGCTVHDAAGNMMGIMVTTQLARRVVAAVNRKRPVRKGT